MSVDQYQRAVNGLDKEIADLEKKKAAKDKEIATLQMELLDELLPTFNHIIAYENTYEWYENLDRIMRDFVDGGANS